MKNRLNPLSTITIKELTACHNRVELVAQVEPSQRAEDQLVATVQCTHEHSILYSFREEGFRKPAYVIRLLMTQRRKWRLWLTHSKAWVSSWAASAAGWSSFSTPFLWWSSWWSSTPRFSHSLIGVNISKFWGPYYSRSSWSIWTGRLGWPSARSRHYFFSSSSLPVIAVVTLAYCASRTPEFYSCWD